MSLRFAGVTAGNDSGCRLVGDQFVSWSMYHQECPYTMQRPQFGCLPVTGGRVFRSHATISLRARERMRAGTGFTMTDHDGAPARYPAPLLPDLARLEELVALAAPATRIVAFTGAGISTESGIPDYRGPGGLWTTGKPPTIGDFLSSDETRSEYWRRRRETYPDLVARQPNAGHRALVKLRQAGRLAGIVTQNIDGLHQKAGIDATMVKELHGTAHMVRCVQCEHREPGAEVQRRQEAGEIMPVCPACGAPMRSATVLFGESMPVEPLREAIELVRSCDLMLVIGSSLVVQPAARLPLLARDAGARLAFINREATPLDQYADVVIRADAGPVLTALAEAIATGDQSGWQTGQ